MHHHSPSILPSLIEESPSDSGCSEETKVTHQEDVNEPLAKNSAIIDLSKPLSKEEMLAIIQILRELWRKQFGSELPDFPTKANLILPTSNSMQRLSTNPSPLINQKNKSHYHSTPSLNKLSAELSDIKDKLKRFSTGRSTNEQQVLQNNKNNGKNHSICSIEKIHLFSIRTEQ